MKEDRLYFVLRRLKEMTRTINGLDTTTLEYLFKSIEYELEQKDEQDDKDHEEQLQDILNNIHDTYGSE